MIKRFGIVFAAAILAAVTFAVAEGKKSDEMQGC